MSDQKQKPRKPRRRPRQSSLHFTVWTMNGSPFPEPVLEELERVFKGVTDESGERLLSAVHKF